MTTTRSDDDLERLLRSTLTTAGDTVTSGPAWPGADDELLPAHAHPRWIAPVAAAAAAAVIAGIVVAARSTGSDTDNRPGSTHAPSSVATSRTTTPKRLGITRTACAIDLPPAWQAAIAARKKLGDFDSATPLTVFPDGRVIESRDLNGTKDVGLLDAKGRFTVLYTAPSGLDAITGAQVEANTVLLTVSRGATDSSHTPTVERLIVIDPGLGQINVADKTGAGGADPKGYIDGAAMLDGRVYYDVRPNKDSDSGRVYALDLNTFPRNGARVVYTGKVDAPTLYNNGVGWTPGSLRVSVARSQPGTVTIQTSGADAPTITDGTSYAWSGAGGSTGIGWYNGRTGLVFVATPTPVTVLAVTNSFVVYRPGTDTQLHIADVRTGATAPFPGDPSGVVAGTGVIATGIDIDPPNGRTEVARLDTAKLPGLTC